MRINEALAQTRRLSRGLCPAVLDSNDIEMALEQLAENMRSIFGVACELECESEIEIADNAVAMHLYRIAQEAATNAVKHGKASTVGISLTNVNDKTVLAVSDNGIGFASPLQPGTGMGLRTMQYRAGMIGASLRVQTPAEGGTRILCSFQNPPSRPPQ